MGSALDRYYAEKKKKVTNNNTPNGSALDRYYKQQSYNNIDTTGVDQKYIDSFINDAKTFLTTAEKDFGGVGWSNASSTYDSRNTSWQDLSTRADTIDAWLYKNKKNLDSESYNSLSSAIGEIRSNASTMLDSFKGAKEYYSQWETEEDYNSWHEHRSKLEADDFEEYSQKGKDASNPTWKDAQAPVNLFGWTPFGDGDDITNMVTFAEANKGEAYKQSAQAVMSGGGSSELAKLVTLIDSQMTDEEKSIYNYYIGKGDSAKAAEYLESLELVKRQGGQIAKQIDDNVFLEAVMGFTAGIETSIQGFKGLADFFTGNESGTNYSATQYADQIASSNNEGFLKGVHDVSSAVGGMTPSILVGSLTGGLGGALTMGASATGNAYNEMIDLGYNQWQARGYGLLVGASEAALSYALGGISKLGGKVTNHAISNLVSKFDNAIARTAIQLGGNMASEGLEEAIQTVLEPAFKALTTGEDFEAPEWEEVWYSALLGALTAGVLEGAPTIANTAIKSYQGNKVYGAEPQALVGEALEIDPDNAHAQRMQARLDNGKNVSGYQLNRLVKTNEQTLYNQDVAKMKSAVEERLTALGETGDISKLVDVIVKAQSGEKLTRSERSTLVNSKYGRRVSTELNPQIIESGEYSSAWAENIGTERINTDAYNKGLYDLAMEKADVAVDEKSLSAAENPTEKENATEAKFEASTDGKTKIGDLEVSIKEIASVKNGEVILRLEDDSTVSAGDVEYGSSAEALLYENVADMNLNAATANAFIKGYDPNTMSADQYAKGFREAYRYGEYNFPIQEMSTKGFSDMLSESQRNLAYNLGKTDAKYKIDAKSAKIAEKIASTSAKNVGKDSQKASKKRKLHNTIAPNTERQRASLKALGVVAETLGIDIYTFESKVDSNGKRQGANGWFDPKDGSIHIDLHAGMSGEGTMLFTAAHELTHFIREWSPAKFKIFADFILENYGKKGVSVEALVNEQIEKAKRNGRTIDCDTAYEEVIADSCESMLADGDVIAKIAELKAKDKTLWQKIKDYLTKLVARIKAAYEGMTPDSVEGRYVAEMLDTAEKLKALWTEALVDASEAHNASDLAESDANTESVAPTMLSERTRTKSDYVIPLSERFNAENKDIRYSDRYSYESLTSKPDMKITDVDDSVQHNRADIVIYALKNAESVGHTNQNGNAVVHVEDIDTDVIVPKRSLVHGLDRRMNTQAPVLIKIGEILKNSIRINELNPRADEIKNSYVLVGVARSQDSRLYIASFVVNQYSNEVTEIDVLYSANAKKESAALLPKITDKSDTPTDSVISIAQLLGFVNRYFPDILPESVLRHYGHDSRPDGKIGESALYSDRDPNSVSNRSLLANALESVAQNDIERKKLEEYKGKIALIESEQAKLTEVRAKIKELSFAKGKRDTEAINKLRFEEKQTANRINTYDKQLLNLESTKALKGVLEREKQMAYKRAEQRGKEALEAYRERATKTQRELMDRYQESRKKGVESRNMTAMRHKIKDVVKELNDYLLKGTKDKHVPIQLQKAVAEALDAVNMDTVGAEERIAKKRAEMMSAKSPEVIERLAKEIEHIQEMGGNMEAKLSRLKTSYDSIINSDDPLIANSHDDVISNTIDKVIEVVGDTALRDMSLYQLEAVHDMYRMVLHSIRSANKTFKAEKGKEISVLANTVISDLDGKKRNHLNPADTKFVWNNLKPVYAFERIGSKTFTKLFNAVKAGEDVWAKDMSEASAFREEQSKKYKYDTFDFEKKYTFHTNRVTPFDLTLGEMMSIYAFAKDEHSKGHLIGEGFVFDPRKEVVENVKGKINVKVNLEDATAYNLSESVVEKITQTLSEITGAKEFVDAMQEYLSSTMGEKGNEVSLELYQVKLFKNKNYFPLKVAPQYMAVAKEKAQGDVKIKNKGFTKDRKEGAKNPIVLSSFMDVWASHVNEMSMYHAFTLPLEDFYRVFNYKTPNMEGYAPMSVNASLENAYGSAATSYIEQLLKDLNGGARVDHTTGVINKLTGIFKKSAVFGSLSVVIQQPSAIARATALVDSKYFVGKKVTNAKHKETWAEVKKYAPVAVIKEMGYFDTGMGQSSVEWLKGEKTWKDKVDDALSKAPALADEYTWCAIWNAVKRETLHTNKDLKPNSDEFLNAVGERFTEVITKTQVYDSVLSRSANMRSKDTGMKMATAFMGEPTTSINMLQDALTQGKRGNKRYARKAIGGVVSSMILNSILVSIVYAGRDDDEEKTYAEKYVGTLAKELIDSVNPLTLIPFVKDVVSIVQGYDVERSDMAVITDVINAWNNLDSDNRSAYRKVEDFAGAIASILGLPVKNIMRDARGMYNTVNSFINGEKTTGAGIGSAVKEAVTGKAESNGQQLYDAILSGDSTQIERVKGRFKDQKAIDSAIRKALRENNPRIKEAAEARYNGDIAGYMRIAKEIIAEGYFKQDDIVSAINSEISALKKGEGTTTASTSSNKVESIYGVGDYYSALKGRDQATAYAVKEDIIKTEVANGKDREEAEADFNSKFASHLRDMYEVGGLSDYEARNMLVTYGGKTEEQAYAKVQYWNFKNTYPDYDLSEEAVTKYYDEVEPSGIGIGVYYDYYKQRSKCKGVDADGDGKTDSGSVKSEVLYIINSLPITNAQKDTLYYLNGWSASTIWEAPWH